MKALRVGVPVFLFVALLLAGVFGQEEPAQSAERYLDLLLKRPASRTLFERFYNAWMEEGDVAGLRRFLENREESGTMLLIRAAVEEELGDDAGSLELLGRAHEISPREPEIAFRLGQQLARAQRSAEALLALDGAEAEGELALQIAELRGRELLRLGNSQAALKVWRGLIAANPDDADLRADVIELLAAEGMSEEAVAELRELLERTRDPYQRALHRLRLADLLGAAGNREEAMEVYRALLEAAGQGTWLEREVLAQIEAVFRRGDGVSALQRFLEEAKAREPGRIAVRVQLAKTLAALREKEAAVAEFEALLEITPGERPIREAFVKLLADLREFQRAGEEIERLAQLFPDDPELLVLLARMRERNGDGEGAVGAIQRFLDAGEPAEHRFLRAARLLAEFRLNADAERVFREMLARFPQSVAARESAAEFFHKRKNQAEALKIWSQLAAGENRDTLLRIAKSAARHGHSREAFAWLEARREEFRTDAGFLEAFLTQALAAEAYDAGYAWLRPWLKLAETPYELETATRLIQRFAKASGRGEELTAELRNSENPAEICVAAALLVKSGKREAALTLLENLARQPGPPATLALSQQAYLHQNARDYRSAAQAMERLVGLPGENKTVHLRRVVRLYRQAGQEAEALRWLRRWKPLSPGNAQIWMQEAETLHSLGREPEAFRLMRQASGRFEDDSRFPAKLAEWYVAAGRQAEAERIYWRLYGQAEALEDKMPWLRKLVDLTRGVGRESGLLARLEERRRQNRGSMAPLLALAEAQRLLGQTDPWRATLRKASRLEPGNVKLLLRIARSYRQEAKFAEARAALERALPGDASGKTEMALVQLLLEAGNGDEAIRRLRGLMERGKLNVSDAELAGMDLARRIGFEPAARFLLGAADLLPDDFCLPYLAGLFFAEAGLPNEAAEAFLRLLGLEGSEEAAGPELPEETRRLMQWWTRRDRAWNYRNDVRRGKLYDTRLSLSRAGYGGGRNRTIQMPDFPWEARELATERLGRLLGNLDAETEKRAIAKMRAAGVSDFQFELMAALQQRRDITEIVRNSLGRPEIAAFWAAATWSSPNPRTDEDRLRVVEVLRENWPQQALMAALNGISSQNAETRATLGEFVRAQLPTANVGKPFLAQQIQTALQAEQGRAADERESPIRLVLREALERAQTSEHGSFNRAYAAYLFAVDRDFDRLVDQIRLSDAEAEKIWTSPHVTTNLGGGSISVPGLAPAMSSLLGLPQEVYNRWNRWDYREGTWLSKVLSPEEMRELSARVERPAWRFLFDRAAGNGTVAEPENYLTDPIDRSAAVLVAWHLRQQGELKRAMEILAEAIPGAEPGAEIESLTDQLIVTILRNFREGNPLPAHLHEAARQALSVAKNPDAFQRAAYSQDPFGRLGFGGWQMPSAFDFAALLNELGADSLAHQLKTLVRRSNPWVSGGWAYPSVIHWSHFNYQFGRIGHAGVNLPASQPPPPRPSPRYPGFPAFLNWQAKLEQAHRLINQANYDEAARVLAPAVSEAARTMLGTGNFDNNVRGIVEWLQNLGPQPRDALLAALEPESHASDRRRAEFAATLEAMGGPILPTEPWASRASAIYREILADSPEDEVLWLRVLNLSLYAGDVDAALEALEHVSPSSNGAFRVVREAADDDVEVQLTAARVLTRWLNARSDEELRDDFPRLAEEVASRLWQSARHYDHPLGNHLDFPALLSPPAKDRGGLTDGQAERRDAMLKERPKRFVELSEAMLRSPTTPRNAFLRLMAWRAHQDEKPSERDFAAAAQLLRDPVAHFPVNPGSANFSTNRQRDGNFANIYQAVARMLWLDQQRTDWLTREVIPSPGDSENASAIAERLRGLETMLFGEPGEFLQAAEAAFDLARDIRGWRELDVDLAEAALAVRRREIADRSSGNNWAPFLRLVEDYRDGTGSEMRERTLGLIRKLADLHGLSRGEAPAEGEIAAEFARFLDHIIDENPVAVLWVLDFARVELAGLDYPPPTPSSADPFADLGFDSSGSGKTKVFSRFSPEQLRLALEGSAFLAAEVENFRCHPAKNAASSYFTRVIGDLSGQNAENLAKLLDWLPKTGFGPELFRAALISDREAMSAVFQRSHDSIANLDEKRRLPLALLHHRLLGQNEVIADEPAWVRQGVVAVHRRAIDDYLAIGSDRAGNANSEQLVDLLAAASSMGVDVAPVVKKAVQLNRMQSTANWNWRGNNPTGAVLGAWTKFAGRSETSAAASLLTASQMARAARFDRVLGSSNSLRKPAENWSKRLRAQKLEPEQWLALLDREFDDFARATKDDPGARLLWPALLANLQKNLGSVHADATQAWVQERGKSADPALREVLALFARKPDREALFRELGCAERLQNPEIPVAVRLGAAQTWAEWITGTQNAGDIHVLAGVLVEAWSGRKPFAIGGSANPVLRAFARLSDNSPEHLEIAKKLATAWKVRIAAMPPGADLDSDEILAVLSLQIRTGDVSDAMQTVQRLLGQIDRLGDVLVQLVDQRQFGAGRQFLAVYGGRLQTRRSDFSYTADLAQKTAEFLQTIETPDRRLLATLTLHALNDEGTQNPARKERMTAAAEDLPLPEKLSRNTLRYAVLELANAGTELQLLRPHLARLTTFSSPRQLLATGTDEPIWRLWWKLKLGDDDLAVFAPILEMLESMAQARNHDVAENIVDAIWKRIGEKGAGTREDFARKTLPILRRASWCAARSRNNDEDAYIPTFTAHLIAGRMDEFANWQASLSQSSRLAVTGAVRSEQRDFLKSLAAGLKGAPAKPRLAAVARLQQAAEFPQLLPTLRHDLFARLASAGVVKTADLIGGDDPPGIALAEAFPRDGYAWAELAKFAQKAKNPALAARCFKRAAESGKNARKEDLARWRKSAKTG